MLKSFAISMLVVSILSGCSHSRSAKVGIQEENLAFIPARIAVLPCQEWPYVARYKNQAVSNFTPEERKEVCDAFDKFVISGFKGQPYMRGLSPKLVAKLLKKSGQETMLSQINKLWHQTAQDCTDCTGPISYYKDSIANRDSWQQWLNKLSLNAYNSDAILLPLVRYTQKGRLDDRGLAIAYKRVGLSLLLIDTNNGRLIWAGGRDAQANNRKLDSEAFLSSLELPKWDQISSRLLVQDIWAEFPGRQNY